MSVLGGALHTRLQIRGCISIGLWPSYIFEGVGKVIRGIPGKIKSNVEVAKDHFPITCPSIKYDFNIFPILVNNFPVLVLHFSNIDRHPH